MERRLEKMNKYFFLLFFLFLCVYVLNNFLYVQSGHANLENNNDLGTVEGWDFNTSRDASQYVLSDNSTIIKPKQFCQSATLLLIIVCSAPGNFMNRKAIRKTWASQNEIAGSTMNVYFLMGDSNNLTIQHEILEESWLYNDIIQDHFVDSYNNLTLKSIVMLKLVSSYCSRSTVFLMKTDDDMFVNMPPLVSMLKKSNASRVLLGSLICGAKPIKDSTNKWYTSKYMYSGKMYPNYLSGTGYVMSIDVVPRLFEAALQTPIFHLEDVYITGILSQVIKQRPRNDGGFTFEKRKFDPCVFKTAYTSHRLTPFEMREHYTQLQGMDIDEACRAKNNTFDLFSIFKKTKSKTKKKKRNLCF